MNLKDEPIEDVVRRFQWVTGTAFKVTNHEGFEKIVDITKNFSEVSFNIDPLYDKGICQERHLMLDTPSINETGLIKPNQCINYLKQTYSKYKSTYYITTTDTERKEKLNKVLFNLDYRVQSCAGGF